MRSSLPASVLAAALVGLARGIGVLCVVLGPMHFLAAAALNTVLYLLLSAAVNAVGHLWGRGPAANPAGNSQWLEAA